MNTDPKWTDERIESLKFLHASNLSASRIAAQLDGGFSRNAVIGKLHRLGIGKIKPPEGYEEDKPERKSRKQAERPAPSLARKAEFVALPPKPVVVASSGAGISILELSHNTCKWPIGDPMDEDFCFCGHGPRDGSPYCEFHARMAYQPQPKRKAS